MLSAAAVRFSDTSALSANRISSERTLPSRIRRATVNDQFATSTFLHLEIAAIGSIARNLAATRAPHGHFLGRIFAAQESHNQ